jgi:hypothetical protein
MKIKRISYESLREDFNNKILKLQAECPHRRKEWVENSIIPFHGGKLIKMCIRCRKTFKGEYEKPSSNKQKDRQVRLPKKGNAKSRR